MAEQNTDNQTPHIETKSMALDPNQGPVDVPLDHPFLQKKLILLNGFSNEEIGKIMHAVKGLYNPPEDLIFAKTTKNSLQMVLKDLIVDISSDHEFLKKNPPKRS